MFSLRDPRFLLRSRDLDVLRAQRIRLFILITHKSARSEHPVTWMLLVVLIRVTQISDPLKRAHPPKAGPSLKFITSPLSLRFLLQVVIDACCYEWWLVLALVLRDNESIIDCIDKAQTLKDVTTETVSRMKQGLMALEEWAEENW